MTASLADQIAALCLEAATNNAVFDNNGRWHLLISLDDLEQLGIAIAPVREQIATCLREFNERNRIEQEEPPKEQSVRCPSCQAPIGKPCKPSTRRPNGESCPSRRTRANMVQRMKGGSLYA